MASAGPPRQAEREILLICARISLDAGLVDRLAGLLRGPLDWSAVVAAARTHGVFPLLVTHLRGAADEVIPAGVRQEMDAAFGWGARRNLRLAAELARLAAALDAHGVRAVAYKGPTLAASVYGNLALRWFGDLDLLVTKGDVLRASAVLGALGYRPRLGLPPAQERALADPHEARVFVGPDSDVVVDLHWAVASKGFGIALQPERLLERARSVALGGARVRILAPDDLLFVLCAHGATHGWDRLGWIVDVAELTRGSRDLDWGRLLRTGKEVGGIRMILLGVALAVELLGVPVPPTVERRVVADRAVRGLVDRVAGGLLATRSANQGILRPFLFYVGTRERLADRLRCTTRFVLCPTPGDWLSLSLPAWLRPAYYVVRPLRLFARYAALSLRHLTRPPRAHSTRSATRFR